MAIMQAVPVTLEQLALYQKAERKLAASQERERAAVERAERAEAESALLHLAFLQLSGNPMQLVRTVELAAKAADVLRAVQDLREQEHIDFVDRLPSPERESVIEVLNAYDALRAARQDAALPTLSELRGIAPDIMPGERSEAFVRRIRNDWSARQDTGEPK